MIIILRLFGHTLVEFYALPGGPDDDEYPAVGARVELADEEDLEAFGFRR